MRNWPKRWFPWDRDWLVVVLLVYRGVNRSYARNVLLVAQDRVCDPEQCGDLADTPRGELVFDRGHGYAARARVVAPPVRDLKSAAAGSHGRRGRSAHRDQ